MKKKRRRRKWGGAVALGMSLALAMTSAPSVWATSSLNEKDGNSTGDTDGSTTIGTYYNDAFRIDTSGRKYGSLLTLNNESNFTVSVPKRISFTNLQDTNVRTVSNAATVKKWNLAPGQKLEVTVEDVTLHDYLSTGNQGGATKTIHAYFSADTDEGHTATLATANDGDFYYKGTENGSIEGEGTNNSPTLNLKAPNAIRAGVWYGKLVYTVSTNAQDGDPGGITTPRDNEDP